MKNLILASVLSVFAFSSFAGDKGNGGDILKCEENGKIVYRTLDSVMMRDQAFYEIKEYKDSAEALKAISTKLAKTLPLLGNKLDTFLKTFKMKRNSDSSVFWIDTKLEQVDDEFLYAKIPAFCEANPIQTVVLVKKDVKRYYYDSSELSKIENTEDELSWMIIHEYLRDYVEDADIIRIINSYFHSEEFSQDTEQVVNKTLENLGIKYGRGDIFSVLTQKKEKAFTVKTKFLENKTYLYSQYQKLDQLGRKEKKELALIANFLMSHIQFNLIDILSLESYTDEFVTLQNDMLKTADELKEIYKVLISK